MSRRGAFKSHRQIVPFNETQYNQSVRSSRPDAELLRAIRRKAARLRRLFARASDRMGFEDPVYRFYHHSFKVFGLQSLTQEIVRELRSLSPAGELDPWFEQIVAQGTGKVFSAEMNPEWPLHTRPIVEAFFHARFFLEMTVRYASMSEAPRVLPSGWAALLCLYRIR